MVDVALVPLVFCHSFVGTNQWELPELAGNILLQWVQQGRPLVLGKQTERHVFLNPRSAKPMDGRRFSEFVGKCFQRATGRRLTEQMVRRIFAKGTCRMRLTPDELPNAAERTVQSVIF